MAKKGKKNSDLTETVDRIIEEVGEDRERLVNFLEGLISEYGGEKSVGIAEYVAKIADALTRQHQVKASVVKSLTKVTTDDEDDDFGDVQNQIGMPFKVEADDGAN